MNRTRLLILATVVTMISTLSASAQKRTQAKAVVAGPPASALKVITSEGLLGHIRVLASDKFEGRGPGTHGEELSINYIADQFRAIGLAPGNTDGSYFQKVPLVGITTKQDATMKFSIPGKDMRLKFGDDFVARSSRVVEKTGFDCPIVFVGYGVVAPEYNWDDYKGMDVSGKLLIMLVNDPPVPDPKNPARLDNNTFKGKAMTYYGRWT